MAQVYTETTNYGFQKPAEANYFDINDLNNALDAIDAELKESNDSIEEIGQTVTETLETQNTAIEAQNQLITAQNQTLATQDGRIEDVEDAIDGINNQITVEGGINSRLDAVETSLNAGLPIGTVNMFAGSAAPVKWSICDGDEFNRVDFAGLFAVIGISYGDGDGVDTFNIPDFRGLFPMGAGALGVNEEKRPGWTNTDYDGGTIGTYSQDTLQSHQHDSTFSHADPGDANSYADTVNIGNHTESSFVINTAGDVKTGGRTDAVTKPASLSVNFIIKVL